MNILWVSHKGEPSQQQSNHTMATGLLTAERGGAAALHVHQNTPHIIATEPGAAGCQVTSGPVSRAGAKTTDKSMAFINAVLICVHSMKRGFAAPAQLKTCLPSRQPVNHRSAPWLLRHPVKRLLHPSFKTTSGWLQMPCEDSSATIICFCSPQIVLGQGDKILLGCWRHRSAVQSPADETVPGSNCRVTRPL